MGRTTLPTYRGWQCWFEIDGGKLSYEARHLKTRETLTGHSMQMIHVAIDALA